MIDHQKTDQVIKFMTWSDFDSDQFWFLKSLKNSKNNPNNPNTSLIAWTLSWQKETLTCANRSYKEDNTYPKIRVA